VNNINIKNVKLEKQKKILVINNGLAFGGIELASVTFANYCSINGYEVTVLALFKSDHCITLNPNILFLEPDFDRKNLNKYVYALRLIKFIRKNIIALKPDVIISHGEWENGYVTLVTRGLKIPLYLQNHMNPNAKFKFFHEKMNKLFYKKAEGVIALTDYAASIIKNRYKVENIIALPNPIREFETENIKEEDRIVTIGRLSREKGHKYLIEAFKLLKKHGWYLDIVGDGPERESLEMLSDDLNCTENIFFHGQQSNISFYLQRAKIFVLPSLSEAFPLALIEAMSISKACVSTDCLAGNEVIVKNNYNGLVVKPGDIFQLSMAMQKLIENEDLRKSLAANAQKIKEELSMKVIYKKYLSFIFKD
jgi:GalNAc-alpha-(1->4)-GalNAc-alpha-(1->3)-diNAcBac-PP-undecaprenol alpha-1,4-N-acetyl-D-galactosaminyltransferase